MIENLPDDLIKCVMGNLCLKDQISCAIASKLINKLISLKLKLYKNELEFVKSYINKIDEPYNIDNLPSVKYVIFKYNLFKFKITLNPYYKLKVNYSYNEDNIPHNMNYKFHFFNVESLLSFITNRIANSIVYSNVFLFSQKYYYFKLY